MNTDGPVLGDDQRVHAQGVRHAQAGTEIVRIGHAVQNQQQRGLFEALEDGVEVPRGGRSLDPRGDALVARVTRHAVEPGALHHDHAHTARLRRLRQVAHAAVAARLIDVDLVDVPRFAPQPADDGVKSVDETCLTHHSACPEPVEGSLVTRHTSPVTRTAVRRA
jgi:hypothetical protein